MNAPWTFVDRYPSLKHSLFESIRFSEHEIKDQDGELRFTGTLLLDGPLQTVGRFLNNLADIALKGAIEEVGTGDETMPRMTLTADTTGSVTLGSFSLTISIEVANNVIINDKDKPIAGPEINLVSSLAIQGHDDLRIVARLGANMRHVIFNAEVPEDLELGLPLLNRLADNTPVAALLPPQMPLVSDLILTGWSIGVAPGDPTPRLTTVSVRVVTRESFEWEIVAGLLSVQRIGFALDVSFLDKGTERYAQMEGRIRLVEDPPVFLDLGAAYPSFVVNGSFDGGEPSDLTALGVHPAEQAANDQCINLRALAVKFLGDAAGGALPDTLQVCALEFELDPKNTAFSLDGYVQTDWEVIPAFFTLTGVTLSLRHLARQTTGTVGASFRLADPENGPEFAVSGSYAGQEAGWTLTGQLTSPEISFEDILGFYFPDAQPPPGNVTITKLSTSVSTGPDKAYGLVIAVAWENIFGGALPLKSLGAAANIDSRIQNGERQYKGRIEGILDFGGFTLAGGFSFDSANDNTIDVTLFDVTAKINTKNPPFILTVSPKGLTFGDVVALLVQAALGGRKVVLPSPWDVLNLISLDGLEFFVNFTDEKIGFRLDLDLNLEFIKLEKISLTYNVQEKTVMFDIEDGSFLGGALPLPKPWDVTDPEQAPEVPGQGSDIFRLKLLAAGQHVAPKDKQLPASVTGALDILQAAFKAPARTPPLQDTDLIFSNEAGWLIGTRATIIGIVNLDAVFYDPLLYGVAISVTGGNFKNLKFEVLYKKVSDSVGVYQIDLTLPDYIRNQDFGTFSVTLPSIRLSIYTNGNFVIDLGFPENSDFSRSFSLQWLPFVGSGGFYYGQLNGETATGLPSTNCGDFNPAIAFGIGVRVGVGKEVNKGILKAGLSLTVQGIMEGLIAVYHPYSGTNLITGKANPPVTLGDGPDAYYFVQGQIALVGRIYGEVNFAIITAELDITARIAVRLVLEAAREILIEFQAGVSVKLKVTINAGLFKIRVKVSFSTTIRADFTIGSNDPNPPWRRCETLAYAPWRQHGTPLDRLAAPLTIPAMAFVPIQPPAPVPLQLYYLPQFSVGEGGESPRGLGVALLYIEAADAELAEPGAPADPRSFEALAEGLLLWTLNAYFQLPDPTVENIEAQNIDAGKLEEILNYFTRTNGDGVPLQPFEVESATAFLAGYVDARIDVPDPNDDGTTDPAEIPNAGLFPMFPFLTLQVGDDTPVNFAVFNRVDDAYLEHIKNYFRELAARFRRESQQDVPNRFDSLVNGTQSLAEFLFVDYLSMLIRALLEDARELFDRATVAPERDVGLRELAEDYGRFGLSAEDWGFLNRTRPLKTGASLTVRGLRARVHQGDTPDAIAQRYGMSPDATAGLPQSIEVGRTLALPDFQVRTEAGDTLLEAANRLGMPMAGLIADNTDGAIFAAGTRLIARGIEAMTVGQVLEQLRDSHRFQNLSGMAARVYLAGLRPPSPPGAEGAAFGEPAPLYALSGQQFDVTDLPESTPITIGLSSGEPLDWLTFGPDFGPGPSAGAEPAAESAISFRLPPDIVALISNLRTAAGSFDPGSQFEDFVLFDVQQRRVTLRNPIPWSRSDALRPGDDPKDPGIWMFPPELVTIINSPKAVDAKFQLLRDVDGDEQPVTPIWSTLTPITVRLAPSGQQNASVPNVYELQDTDDNGALLLEQLLIRAAGEPAGLDVELQLLYPEEPIAPGDDTPPVGLKSDGADDTSLFLLQTNLSTVSNPSVTPGAAEAALSGSHLVGMTGIELLKLVWEGTVVRSGGYFLHYQVDSTKAGLPDYLFNETPSTTVFLLITTNIAMTPGGDPLPPFLNAVTTTEPVDPRNELLFVRALPQSITNLSMASDETLADIARRYRTTVGAIARANATRRLDPDTWITLPPTVVAGTDGPQQIDGFRYQPLPDTTPATIAFYRNVSVTALAYANRDTPHLFADPLSFDDVLQVKIPQIPPGNVGLALTRPNPDQNGAPVQAQLLELYNWLSYRIAAYGVFPRSDPALPIGPTEPDANAVFDPDADTRPPAPLAGVPWTYEGVLSVFLEPAESADPLDPTNDPYATVGQSVRLDLAWQDVFGNTLPVAGGAGDEAAVHREIAIRYIDEVVGLDAWPNVIANFAIQPPTEDGKNPRLVFFLRFIRDRYSDVQSGDPVTQARSDRDQFQTVFFQIKQEDVLLSLDSSTEVSGTFGNFKPQILTWLRDVVTFLDEVIQDGPPTNNPPPLVLEVAFDLEGDNPKNLFPLAIGFHIQRDIELVNDQLKDVPGVIEASSRIAPDIEHGDETGSLPPLRRFATQIELAFPEIHVLTGSRQSDEGSEADLWLARFGAAPIQGIELDIKADRPYFFAPAPLATTLLSRPDIDHQEPVPVYPYVPGEFIGDQVPAPRIVTGIDMESIARDFVTAVDDFLGADLSVPAWILEHNPPPGRVAPGGRVSSRPGQPDPITEPFETIIDAKASIAGAIAGDVIPVLDDPKPEPRNLAEAREQWRQQLLIQLANAYRIETGVQYDVDVKAMEPPPERAAPRVFGKVVPRSGAPAERAFSFNASSIPLIPGDNGSFLSAMLDVRQAKAQRNLKVDLDLQLTQIERDIRDVPQIEGYQASSWLSFVNPFVITGDAGALLQPTIPIPLRAYPTPPSLTEQNAAPTIKQFTAARGADPQALDDGLEEARAWTYAFSYEGVEADQDTVFAIVDLNVRQNTPTAFADPDEPDLLEALVQFSAVYPEVAADLEQVRNGKDDPVSRNALASFAWLVQRVGNAWPEWRQSQQALAALREPADRASTFKITELGSGEDPLTVRVSRTRETGAPIAVPVIDIEGYTAIAHAVEDAVDYTYEDASGNPLSARKGKGIPGRTARIKGFDVLKEENAWSGVYIVRNQDLVPGTRTVEDFLYQTPIVRFIDPVTPLLDPNIEINIAAFTPDSEPHPLIVFLGNFFNAFFKGAVSTGDTRTLALGASYTFGLSGTDTPGPDALRVDKPILITTPRPFPVNETGGDNPFLESVAGEINRWLVENDPIDLSSDGKLQFDLTVYASLADSKLPVLRLRRLTLSTARLIIQ